MAGVITGSIDHRLGQGGQIAADNQQEHFTTMLNYFDSKYTRIASNYGSGGTGLDFFDGTNPSGENAWAVWTATNAADPFDIMIQWADGTNFGNAPGNPGRLGGATADGTGIVMAMREDGSSPWAGGTANGGADTKGATVWTPGGSTLHVLDRANSPGAPAGDFNTNKENTAKMIDISSTGIITRVQIVGDDDGFLILSDRTDDGAYTGQYCGAYTPRTGIAIPSPLVSITDSGAGFWAQSDYGTEAGNAVREGSILGRLLADGARSFNIGVSNSGAGSDHLPNSQLATPDLEPELIALLRNELNLGLCGYLPLALVTSIVQINNHKTNVSGTRAYLGSNGASSRKWSIPWDGGPAPGQLQTRLGRQF